MPLIAINKMNEPIEKIQIYNNWIRGEPAITYKEVTDIVGDDFTPYDFYETFYHVGGLIDSPTGVDAISLRDGYVYDVYGEDLLSKQTVEEIIKRLQLYCDNYNEYYDRYMKRFNKKIDGLIENAKNIVERKRKIKKQREERKKQRGRVEYGYIYVMLHQGYYKIGKSVDCMRLGEYTKLAEEPEYVIVIYVKHMSEMERKLHKMFQDKRCRNGSCEWFSLNDDDLNTICETLLKDEVKDHEHTIGYRRYVLKEDV